VIRDRYSAKTRQRRWGFCLIVLDLGMPCGTASTVTTLWINRLLGWLAKRRFSFSKADLSICYSLLNVEIQGQFTCRGAKQQWVEHNAG
jgi:hypothetical protein